MSNHTEVADVLDDAADYIEEHGLQRNASKGANGQLCSMRSIDSAAWRVEAGVSWRLCWDAAEALAKAAGLRGYACVPAWNDDPETPEQTVLDAFRAAAKLQRRLADGLE